ncbi:unnamed protein product [Fraxinus pennsylvanica]|uniref:Uncharacterized protein n=1 Tax=Fraxinus pennsylvanica TaxID=56036 RepID=A0AAD1ZZ69_9LAMI|nr:unnamed protein product [Fraxinus pennsylvanica]
MMCGDGINDVGALKQAHIGVGFPSAKPLPSNSQVVSMWASNPDMIVVITTELGDASITSSFVAKRTSVAFITDIIRQGCSNLVINLQMLKIIFLQTAYLSVMYLYGMKETSIQATIHVVSATAFFQFMQHALPLGTLSAERSHSNKLCTYVFLSVLGQFGVHLLVLVSCVKDAENYMPDEFIEQEDSLMSTVSFMVCMMILVATYTANYMGHPFKFQSKHLRKQTILVCSRGCCWFIRSYNL